MTHAQIMAFLIGLAIFFFVVGLTAFESLVKSYRAQAWISTVAMCACFWSIVAAVVVGLSS